FFLVEGADRFGSGSLRLTARQGIEVLGVSLDRLGPLYRFLAERVPRALDGNRCGFGGALCCPRTGLCTRQAFDIREWLGKAADRARECCSPVGTTLKMTFSGCGQDCALASISDLGFIASVKNGRRGFRIYSHPRPGTPQPRSLLLYDWVPCESVSGLLRSMESVLADLGDALGSSKGAVSVLAESIGVEKFVGLVTSRLGNMCAGHEVSPIPNEKHPDRIDPSPTPMEDWVVSKFQVHPQIQNDLFTLGLTPPLGILERDSLRRLMTTLLQQPSLEIRLGVRRNMYLSGIPGPQVAQVARALLPSGILERTNGLSHVLSCPGPDSCAAAICNAPGLAQELIKEIRADERLSQLKHISINISGCPTNCSRHLSAAIGLSGALGDLFGKPAPWYDIWLGGEVREGRTLPAVHAGKLVAAHVVPWLKEFLSPIRDADESVLDYLHAKDSLERAADLIRRYNEEATQNGINLAFFNDFGKTAPFGPPLSVRIRAENYQRNPAGHHLERALVFRRKLPELTRDLDRDALLGAIFRESCLAMAHVMKVDAEREEPPLEALGRALAATGAIPSAEAISMLEAVQSHGWSLVPYRKEILFLNYHVEKLFRASRPGNEKAR
ncbi:MAG TPA: nitrite/sulfite reductase, partial [Fibrobacteria bacterium]|nr:nitrite/sulfite reductase [Fibrobacteria bacterium]